jgi:lysophospholipase L1-like esterase
MKHLTRRFATLALVLVPWAHFALAQEHWVATWAASPQQPQQPRPPQAPAAAPTGTPAPPQQAAPPPITNFHDQTVRMIVRTSIGGRRVRVQLSNAFGTGPLMVGTAHVALRDKESAIVAGSDRALAFSGKPAVMIPPGAQMVSDPVDLNVPPLGDLAISVYIPGDSGPLTTHATALHTSYISQQGDFAGAPALPDATKRVTWYWISSIDVLAPADAGAIVAFGDSITDGATSTVDADRSWPSMLARRLVTNAATSNLAIVNQGISGNRLLRDNAGINALARLDRDVLSQPGVKWMTVMEGINDIGRATGRDASANDAVIPDDLIGALRQIVERAHTRGIKVIGCTLTPYEGAAYYSETGEVMRQAVNRWIRTAGAFDAVVDFDSVVRDPDNPKRIRPDFNERDHLHPNDAGYKAMADAIDLAIFTPKTISASSQSH